MPNPKVRGEAKFRKFLIRNMPGHWSMVESPITSAGIPDLDFCINGIEGHVELKYASEKKSPELRTSQRLWFRRRLAEGGTPVIFIEYKLKDGMVYALFCAKGLKKILGQQNKAITYVWLMKHADFIWKDEPHWGRLIEVLTRQERSRPTRKTSRK
jgi:hypothetical protein